MLQPWSKDGKSGNIQFPEGEVVCQQPKGSIQIMPVYQDFEGNWYIEVDGKLQPAVYNAFNGYVYRQDGL